MQLGEEGQLGVWVKGTNTFIVVKSEEEMRVLLGLIEEQRRKEEEENKIRRLREMDDFLSSIVEEVSRNPYIIGS